MNFNKIRTYISESEFKVILLNNKVNVVNYTDIGDFDQNKIIIKYDLGYIILNGKNLAIVKLLNNELLIEGKIESIINEQNRSSN